MDNLAPWYNKENGKPTHKPEDWDNPKGNFVRESPGEQCISGEVVCSWNTATKAWDVDVESQEVYENKQSAILKFRTSVFNNITIGEARDYVNDGNWTSLANSKEAFLKLVEFTIGLREILRQLINHEE